MTHPIFRSVALFAALLLAGGAALAQARADGAWARPSLPGQSSSAAYLTLQSPTAARLVEVRTPAAGIVELHEMALQGDVMRMRAVDVVELKPGQPVEFKPGGLHVMLMDLKQPLKAGDELPLTLVLEGADGKRQTLELKAAVRPPATPGAGGGHGGHRH